jgi:hypothetical protein
MNQPVIIIFRKAKFQIGEIAAKNADASLQQVMEALELHVQLHGTPQAHRGFLRIARPYQQVQRSIMILQKIGRNVRTNVSG